MANKVPTEVCQSINNPDPGAKCGNWTDAFIPYTDPIRQRQRAYDETPDAVTADAIKAVKEGGAFKTVIYDRQIPVGSWDYYKVMDAFFAEDSPLIRAIQDGKSFLQLLIDFQIPINYEDFSQEIYSRFEDSFFAEDSTIFIAIKEGGPFKKVMEDFQVILFKRTFETKEEIKKKVETHSLSYGKTLKKYSEELFNKSLEILLKTNSNNLYDRFKQFFNNCSKELNNNHSDKVFNGWLKKTSSYYDAQHAAIEFFRKFPGYDAEELAINFFRKFSVHDLAAEKSITGLFREFYDRYFGEHFSEDTKKLLKSYFKQHFNNNLKELFNDDFKELFNKHSEQLSEIISEELFNLHSDEFFTFFEKSVSFDQTLDYKRLFELAELLEVEFNGEAYDKVTKLYLATNSPAVMALTGENPRPFKEVIKEFEIPLLSEIYHGLSDIAVGKGGYAARQIFDHFQFDKVIEDSGIIPNSPSYFLLLGIATGPDSPVVAAIKSGENVDDATKRLGIPKSRKAKDNLRESLKQ